MNVRLMAWGLSVVSPMMMTYGYHLLLSILGAKILHDPAARVVGVVSLVVLWRLVSVVTQPQAMVMYARNCVAAGWRDRLRGTSVK